MCLSNTEGSFYSIFIMKNKNGNLTVFFSCLATNCKKNDLQRLKKQSISSKLFQKSKTFKLSVLFSLLLTCMEKIGDVKMMKEKI